MINIKPISLLDPKPKLQIWPLTLKIDLDLILQLKTCGFMRYTCTPNINCLSLCDQKLWPLTFKSDLDMPTPKCAASWDSHAFQILGRYLFWFKSYGYLTFDVGGWPWPWHVMFKICSFKKYICIINIKSLSLLAPKLWHKL